jgi:hypothetical protein
VVFTGTLRRLAYTSGPKPWLWLTKVPLRDLAVFVETMTVLLTQTSEAEAPGIGRPIRHLPSAAVSKEDVAHRIARADGIEDGLICVLTAFEPCWSFQIRRDRDGTGARSDVPRLPR